MNADNDDVTSPRRVLLVDDDARLLGAMRRRLMQLDPTISVQVAQGGEEALRASFEQTFDLVISDLRMPRIGGASVLHSIRRQCPKTLRVILSGQATAEKLLEVLPFSHRYIEKPCSEDELRRLIDLTYLTAHSSLPPALLNQVLTLTSLPCEGTLYSHIQERIVHGASERDIDRLINSDLGMALGLLRVVSNVLGNSTVSEQFSPTVATLPLQIFERVFGSQLLAPLFVNEDLLRTSRLISIKYRLLEHQLRSGDIASSRLLAMLAYLGELALLTCIGADEEMLCSMHASRDEVARILGNMWGIPSSLLDILSDEDLQGLRSEIDAFFPHHDLIQLSDEELLDLYSEVLCWMD